MNIDKNYYSILYVLPTAESLVIRAAYKALVQHYHPDKYKGDVNYAHNKMAELNEAYEVLSNSEKRREYDELRGENARDASSFFDDLAFKSTQGADESIDSQWKIAEDFYPDLTEIEAQLAKISRNLVFTFKAALLESKRFEDRHEIVKSFKQDFLKLFFGENIKLVSFAEGLINCGNKNAAKDLNKAVTVLGAHSDPLTIINRISEKYLLNLTNEQERLLISFLNGNWSDARSLLNSGVSPIGIFDRDGRTLREIAENRKDNLMMELLSSFRCL